MSKSSSSAAATFLVSWVSNTCGADHMHRACLGAQFGKRDGCCGGREINHNLRFCDRLKCVIRDHNAHITAAHRSPDIAPDPIVTCAFNGPDQTHPIRFANQLDQHLAHTA
jgi:hypothetical protein